MNLVALYAINFVGLPYRWGGDDAIEGFDCSGLALEVLSAFGFKLPDMNAHALYRWCKESSYRSEGRAGALVFYGRPDAVTHVGVMINKDLMVEAGGGGSQTLNRQAAVDHNAYIRIRPITSRKDLVGFYYPPYALSLVVA